MLESNEQQGKEGSHKQEGREPWGLTFWIGMAREAILRRGLLVPKQPFEREGTPHMLHI